MGREEEPLSIEIMKLHLLLLAARKTLKGISGDIHAI